MQFGGAERGNISQAVSLSQLGVEVVTASPSTELAASLEAHGARHLLIELPSLAAVKLGQRQIAELVSSERPDIVHLQLLRGAIEGGLSRLRFRWRQPTVISLHNSLADIEENLSSLPGRLRLRTIGLCERAIGFCNSSQYVAVSDYESKRMKGLSYARSPKHTIVNDAVSSPFPSPASQLEQVELRAQFDLPSDQFIVGFFGRHEYQKGADLVSEASGLLSAEGCLVVTTSSGSMDLSSSTRNLPHQESLAAIIRACDVVLVPSRYEAFGRIAAEALLEGVPTIHSGVGGLSEVTAGISSKFSVLSGLTRESLLNSIVQHKKSVALSPITNIERIRTSEVIGERFSSAANSRSWLELYTSVLQNAKQRVY